MSRIYHVSVGGSDRAAGTESAPFRTINRAAAVAAAGDTVRVHEGVYREWVDPQNGGVNDLMRVTYEAASGEHVVITGAEPVTGWKSLGGGVWTVSVPNALFGDWNPYAEPVGGDWLISPTAPPVHTGDVYLNGVSLYEAASLDALRKAERRESGHQVPWIDHTEKIDFPERTAYQWYAEVGADETTLWANFQDKDPNAERIEMNVRKCCFYPRRTGVNFITVRGFEICQAACPFTPPTADQPGMVGPHWSRGWIIENNHLHDAKCSAISIGKEISTGHNLYSRFGRKPGYQYQMESVFLALQAGWSKEKIGSHIIRNNVIHDCGQNAVVGHMGCAFSRIEHNHIYRVATKHEFFGYEIAGIKLHAAVDVVIADNNLHDCSLGIWLDWQAQGTRVTRNLFHRNDRDLMIEVTHGPCLVDNNLFLSPYAFDNMAQGTAFVHNLIAGYMHRQKVLDRATPYHFAHSTQAAGCAVVYSGDDRLVNNLFAGMYRSPNGRGYTGGAGYDDCTTAEEYPRLLAAEGNTDEAKYYKINQPVYASGNVYAGCAEPFRGEADACRAEAISAALTEEAGAWVLTLSVPENALRRVMPVTTAALGAPRITEEPYENPDGTPVDFTRDLLGAHREGDVFAGPLAALRAGENKVVLWRE